MSDDSPLGKPTEYPDRYAPEVLFAIPRDQARQELGIDASPPFHGVDIWNVYELSWLTRRGKPVVATAEIRIPATSPNIIESKSLKLYLNSLNTVCCASVDALQEMVAADLQKIAGDEVSVQVTLPSAFGSLPVGSPAGICIDAVDVACDVYEVDARLLAGSADASCEVDETLYSNLLRSQCPVTSQPDWATVSIHYRGGRIEPSALLRYIVSYRNHGEFHEHCVERIFMDIQSHCRPEVLSVYARYTRRGGLDINPFRSNFEPEPSNHRLWRQ